MLSLSGLSIREQFSRKLEHWFSAEFPLSQTSSIAHYHLKNSMWLKLTVRFDICLSHSKLSIFLYKYVFQPDTE